jgi:hypothetical protein
MSRLLSRFGLIVLAIGALTAFLMLSTQPLTATEASVVPTANFDIDADIVPGLGWGIPPDCSTWHELYPNYCTPHHQSQYQDTDGSGTVTVCDNIVEGSAGACWHIEKVSTTYFFSPVTGGGQSAAEPETEEPGSPVCNNWHIIFSDGPDFSECQMVHIDGWEDNNQNGTLDACDNVQILGGWYHIDRVGCDVTVVFNPVTAAKGGTWGWLKSLFGRK